MIEEDFTKSDPWDYKALKNKIEIVNLENRSFVWIDGKGDPNEKIYSWNVSALYNFSYTLKMSYKKEDSPQGAHNYSVGLLQGYWTLQEGIDTFSPEHKDQLQYRIMIRQPRFLTKELFDKYKEIAKIKAEKKKVPGIESFNHLQYGSIGKGQFAQILHIGSYDDEPRTFYKLNEQLNELDLRMDKMDHWEIYLNDPRRTSKDRLKTILRVELTKEE